MDAVIPIAGKGTRLKSITKNKPKCLVELNNDSILEHLFKGLKNLVSNVYLIVNPEQSKVQKKIGNFKYGLHIHYLTQNKQKGVAHAVFQAKDEITDNFILVMGDNYFSTGFQTYVKKWKNSNSDGGILAKKANKSNGTGIWVKNEKVISLKKYYDGEPDLIGCGFFILPPEIFDSISKIDKGVSGEYEIEDSINHLIQQNFQFVPIKLEGERLNINRMSDLKKVKRR